MMSDKMKITLSALNGYESIIGRGNHSRRSYGVRGGIQKLTCNSRQEWMG